MAKDFRATQIETTKLILSGGIGSKGIGGLIYSGSVATNRNGGIPLSMLSDVGTDVFLFVSGTKSNTDFNRTDVTLFGGDVVISGTLYAERQVIEVDSVSDGDFFVTGNMFVKPDSNSLNSVEFTDRFGRSFFKSNTLQKQILFLSGGAVSSADESSKADVAFYVSGARGSRGTGIRGTSVFGGDLVISGTLHADSQAFVKTLVGQALNVTTNNVVINEGGSAFLDFRVETDTKTNAIFVDASNDSVSILGGGGVYPGTDVGFFVSGAIGEAGTASAKSISSFGGDLVISGSTHTGGAVHRKMLFKASNFIVGSDDHYIFVDTTSGHVTASLQTAAAAGAGRELIFKDVGGRADANFIVIKPPIGNKIESVPDELKIKVASGSISLISDGVENYYAFSARD